MRNFVHNTIQLTSGIQGEGAPCNVLAQHRKKNHSNKPPGLDRLTAAAFHQTKKHGQDDKENPQESDDEDPEEDKDQPRAARHSKYNGERKPDTMVYYRGTPWSAILTQAKIKYRRHIALNHGFPDRDEHLCDARDILLEAIEEYKNENGILDQSRFVVYFIYVRLLIILFRFPTRTGNGVFGMFDIGFERLLLIHSTLDIQGRSHIPW